MNIEEIIESLREAYESETGSKPNIFFSVYATWLEKKLATLIKEAHRIWP